MKFVSIRSMDYYDHPEYYAFMPRSVFDALEEAELKGAIKGQEIIARVPEEDWNLFLDELTKYKKSLTNAGQDS